MKVLVAGGAGFIGSHLVDRLLEQGSTVIVVDNLSSPPHSWENLEHHEAGAPLAMIKADLGVPTTPMSEPLYQFDDVDLVYHLASPCSPPLYLKRPVETLRAGSVATERLLMFAAGVNARFVLASTSEVYGDPLEHPQSETYRGNVDPTSPRACYDEAKRYAEALTFAYWRTRGVDVRIARIFNTYGPRMGDDGRVMSNFIRQALSGEPLTIYGDGQQTRSFCYVRDVVAALSWLGRSMSNVNQPINIGSDLEVTIERLARLVLQVAGRDEHEYRTLSADRAPHDPQRRCPDLSRAAAILGWQPTTPLAMGIQSTLDWFRSR